MKHAPLESIVAPCPESVYKDDRHEWNLLIAAYSYELRTCKKCGLHVLAKGREVSSPYSSYSAPRKNDEIVVAFYETERRYPQ